MTHVVKDAVKENYARAHRDTDRDQLVLLPDLVQVAGQGPGSRVGVVGLEGRAAPGGVAVPVDEKLTITPHDGDHHRIVDEATEDGAIYLG